MGGLEVTRVARRSDRRMGRMTHRVGRNRPRPGRLGTGPTNGPGSGRTDRSSGSWPGVGPAAAGGATPPRPLAIVPRPGPSASTHPDVPIGSGRGHLPPGPCAAYSGAVLARRAALSRDLTTGQSHAPSFRRPRCPERPPRGSPRSAAGGESRGRVADRWSNRGQNRGQGASCLRGAGRAAPGDARFPREGGLRSASVTKDRTDELRLQWPSTKGALGSWTCQYNK